MALRPASENRQIAQNRILQLSEDAFNICNNELPLRINAAAESGIQSIKIIEHDELYDALNKCHVEIKEELALLGYDLYRTSDPKLNDPPYYLINW